MTVMPLVEVEAPRTGKISKNRLYYTLHLS